MELHEQVETVVSREDLVAFIEALRRDLIANPEQWENPTLESFLEALAAWTHDCDGYYKNVGRTPPTTPEWRTFADMLIAATMYE